MRKSAGAAPIFDKESKRLLAASEAPRGMISNPWVRHWVGEGPAPAEPTAALPSATHPHEKAAGNAPQRKRGKRATRKKASE
jgi:hypothetical protein